MHVRVGILVDRHDAFPLVVARVRAPIHRCVRHHLCAARGALGGGVARGRRQGREDPHGPVPEGSAGQGRQLPVHRLRHPGVREERRRRPGTSGARRRRPGQRSDTIMVAHIDPGGKHRRARVVPARSLGRHPRPRQRQDQRRVQRSAVRSSPIETIEQDFNIPISHYLEVDFAGFRDIVNAIGTVPDLLPDPGARQVQRSDDREDRVVRTSTVTQALAYVRSRYYEYKQRRRVAVRPDFGPRPHPSPAVLHPHARAGRDPLGRHASVRVRASSLDKSVAAPHARQGVEDAAICSSSYGRSSRPTPTRSR